MRTFAGRSADCGIHILLAAPNEALRGLLGDALRDDGYSVTEVEHGEELLRALKEAQDPGRRPHLVVCDQQMPGMTALDALERATKGNRPFPVLLMTVHRDAELLLRASRLNVTAVFRKPFEVDDLRTAVLWLVPREQRGLH